MKSKILVASLLTTALGLANAADIEISNIYAKATLPGAKNTALFFEIKNYTNTPAAAISEIHTHQEVDGMKKMVQIDDIEIAPESTVSLEPGGLHVMLMNIKAPIKEGDKLEAVLEFDNGEKIEIKDIVAKPVMAKKEGGRDHGGHMDMSKQKH